MSRLDVLPPPRFHGNCGRFPNTPLNSIDSSIGRWVFGCVLTSRAFLRPRTPGWRSAVERPPDRRVHQGPTLVEARSAISAEGITLSPSLYRFVARQIRGLLLPRPAFWIPCTNKGERPSLRPTVRSADLGPFQRPRSPEQQHMVELFVDSTFPAYATQHQE